MVVGEVSLIAGQPQLLGGNSQKVIFSRGRCFPCSYLLRVMFASISCLSRVCNVALLILQLPQPDPKRIAYRKFEQQLL